MRITKLTVLPVLFFVLFSCNDSPKKRVLPIVGEREVNYYEIDGKEVADTVYPKVPDFKYLNQDSAWVTSESLKNKVWVVDFFFTHCPTICPPMTSQMKRLNTMVSDLSEDVEFLSFSIDPKRDFPTRLREYIQLHGIKAQNWQFLTGDEAETHEMARKFYTGAERNSEAAGGFGHTDTFVLVDKEGYVRGVYSGTNTEQVDQLEKDLRKLLKYEYDITGSR